MKIDYRSYWISVWFSKDDFETGLAQKSIEQIKTIPTKDRYFQFDTKIWNIKNLLTYQNMVLDFKNNIKSPFSLEEEAEGLKEVEQFLFQFED